MAIGSKKKKFNFHDLLLSTVVLVKHLRLISLIVCFAVILCINYYVWARPVYFSRSTVSVVVDKRQLDTGSIYRDDHIGAVSAGLVAPHIVERTAKRLGVKAGYRDLVQKHVYKIKLAQSAERKLEVDVWTYSPEWARAWTRAMVDEFESYRRERRMEELDKKLRAYQEDIDEYEKRLAANIKRTADFNADEKATNARVRVNELRNVPLLLIQTRVKLRDIAEVKKRLQDPRLEPVSRLAMIDSVLSNLEIGSAAGPGVTSPVLSVVDPGRATSDIGNAGGAGSANTGGVSNPALLVVTPATAGADPRWIMLERSLQEVRSRRAELGSNLLPGHPEMVKLSEEESAIERKLARETSVAERALEIYREQLTAREAELEKKVPELDKAEAHLDSLRLRSSLNETSKVTWQGYIQRMTSELETLQVASDRERVDLLFDGISLLHDRFPISPNRLMLAIVALGGGLALGVGAVFLVEYLDHTLTSLEQVESTFQIRGLGIVPKVETQEEPNALLDKEEAKEFNLIENFRVIRTNLVSMGHLSKEPQVLMVSSAMPKEGKTVISSNLSLSFAQAGVRTLLIDTDLRRGRMHRLFGYRKTPGLSGLLLGEVTLDEVIRPTRHDNLFLISAGSFVESGPELLGSSRFGEIVAELRKRFDRVILDTPPILGLSETSVLQRFVDGVVFVVWAGNTPIKVMQAAVDMLLANGANFYGFVLNRLDLNNTANYYQYYYYSHDYYYNYSPQLDKAESAK
jgi:capsular exopolysaccharide synthesis family protein